MTGTNDAPPRIRSLDEESGVRIFDPVEAAQFTLFTSGPVDPAPADPEDFFFPMDVAVRFRTDGLIVPKLLTVHLRATGGEFVSTFDPSRESELVESGPLIIQLSTAPMTLYLKTAADVTIRRHEQSVILSFGERAPVELAVRSFHDAPAATIQVPDDPADVMTAISRFGSALQTLSPERSFGTLRGHPPALERGPSLEIPDSLDRPDSPVTMELPPAFEYVYPAAPLAFYLGATVEPGPEPRLRCGDLDRSLAGDDGFQATVQDLFQHVFFMDCVTRTEGLYPVELHERAELERVLDEPVDFAALYEASLADQLRRYLELPLDRVEAVRPTWHLCTDVEPEAAFVESLPAIVNELPLIRCPYTETAPPGARGRDEPMDAPERRAALADIDEFVRRPDADPADGQDWPLPEDTFSPPSVPAIEHEWLGTGIPLGANKATPETYRRRQDRPPADAEEIAIDVVCNDPPMDAERVVEHYYGLRDLVTFDVTVHDDLTREELADVLAAPTELLHFIGHVDRRGFRCSDGSLDARTLSDVGCRAFLLNACTSYRQGQALIDAGSYGGVVTLTDVGNDVATETGRTIARLLNAGFTLRSALSITHDHHPTGQQYVVVGDGSIQLVQNESGVPYKVSLRQISDAEKDFEFDFHTYPTSSAYTPGSFITPTIGDLAISYLPFGYIDTFQPSRSELMEFLALENMPTEFNGELVWSHELNRSGLRSSSSVTSVRDDHPDFR